MNTASENRLVLLQHARTRLFYVRDGDWTSDPARARDFVTTQAAVLYSHSRAVTDTQLVIHFSRPELRDVVIPTSTLAFHAPLDARG